MLILLDIIHCLKGKGLITQLKVGSGSERTNQINRQVLFFVIVDSVFILTWYVFVYASSASGWSVFVRSASNI